jgi:hypothetical protein
VGDVFVRGVCSCSCPAAAPRSLSRPQLLTLVWICVRHRIKLNDIIHPLCSVLFYYRVLLALILEPPPRRVSHSPTLLTTTITSLTTARALLSLFQYQHVHSLSVSAALVWPPAALPSRLGLPTEAALPFHHFLASPEHFPVTVIPTSQSPHTHVNLHSNTALPC